MAHSMPVDEDPPDRIRPGAPEGGLLVTPDGSDPVGGGGPRRKRPVWVPAGLHDVGVAEWFGVLNEACAPA